MLSVCNIYSVGLECPCRGCGPRKVQKHPQHAQLNRITYVRVRTHARTYVRTYTVRTYIRTYIRMYVRTYVCNACTYVNREPTGTHGTQGLTGLNRRDSRDSRDPWDSRDSQDSTGGTHRTQFCLGGPNFCAENPIFAWEVPKKPKKNPIFPGSLWLPVYGSWPLPNDMPFCMGGPKFYSENPNSVWEVPKKPKKTQFFQEVFSCLCTGRGLYPMMCQFVWEVPNFIQKTQILCGRSQKNPKKPNFSRKSLAVCVRVVAFTQ